MRHSDLSPPRTGRREGFLKVFQTYKFPEKQKPRPQSSLRGPLEYFNLARLGLCLQNAKWRWSPGVWVTSSSQEASASPSVGTVSPASWAKQCGQPPDRPQTPSSFLRSAEPPVTQSGLSFNLLKNSILRKRHQVTWVSPDREAHSGPHLPV